MLARQVVGQIEVDELDDLDAVALPLEAALQHRHGVLEQRVGDLHVKVRPVQHGGLEGDAVLLQKVQVHRGQLGVRVGRRPRRGRQHVDEPAHARRLAVPAALPAAHVGRGEPERLVERVALGLPLPPPGRQVGRPHPRPLLLHLLLPLVPVPLALVARPHGRAPARVQRLAPAPPAAAPAAATPEPRAADGLVPAAAAAAALGRGVHAHATCGKWWIYK